MRIYDDKTSKENMTDMNRMTSNMKDDDIIGVLGMYEWVLENPARFEAWEPPVPWVTWNESGNTYICVLRTYRPYEYRVYCEKNGSETDWESIKMSFDRLKAILTQRLSERNMMDYDEQMFAFDYENGFSFASVS